MLVSPATQSENKKTLIKKILFGVEPSVELAAILLVYFVQGILGLARLAVTFFFKDELGLSPAKVSALIGITYLPWSIKLLYGFISDSIPILGYRRRPYLILSGILGSAAWVSMATLVHSPWGAVGAITLSSLSVAFSDVIADSVIVERARVESLSNAGSLQSLVWAASALGGLISAYFSGLLLEHFSTRTVFGMTAIFPLIVAGTAWLITEKQAIQAFDPSNVWKSVKEIRKAISQKAIWLPIAFIFIWHGTPSSESAMFFFSTNELGFDPEFLGRVQLVTSVASLLGVWLFQRFLKTIPFRTIFGWTIIFSTILGMTMLLLVTHTNRALGIDDHWFSIGDSLILTVMRQIAWMPILVLAARLCPPGVEASFFALVMSVNNLAGLLSREFGAILTHWLGVTETNFENLWLLVLLTNLSTFVPFVFLNWLPANDPLKEAQNEMSDKALV